MGGLASQRVQPVEDRVDMARKGSELEDRVEIDLLCDLGVGSDELSKVELFVPRPQRVPLHPSVGVVARKPGVHEREKQPLAEEQAVTCLEVLSHALGKDDE